MRQAIAPTVNLEQREISWMFAVGLDFLVAGVVQSDKDRGLRTIYHIRYKRRDPRIEAFMKNTEDFKIFCGLSFSIRH